MSAAAPTGKDTAPGLTVTGPDAVRGKRDAAVLDDERAGAGKTDRGLPKGFDPDPLGARRLIEDFADLPMGNPQALYDILWVPEEKASPRFHYFWADKYGAGKDTPAGFARSVQKGYQQLTKATMYEGEHFEDSDFDSSGERRCGELVLMRIPMAIWEKRERYKQLEALGRKIGKTVADMTVADVQAEYLSQIANGALSPDGRPDPRSPIAAKMLQYKSPLLQ